MSTMKNREDQSPDRPGQRMRPETEPGHGVGATQSNEAFLLAFVDALRDILRDERRPVV